MPPADDKLAKLEQRIGELGSLVVCYSGGVDSAFVLLVAHRVLGERAVGVTAVSPDRAGAADVSFVAGEVKAIIDGVGLMGHDDHTAKETADLTTLPSQAKRMAVLLHRLVRLKADTTGFDKRGRLAR